MNEPRRTPPKPDTIQWKFWKAALRGEKLDTPLAQVSIGYYRTQVKDTGEWYPVAIYFSQVDGFKHCKTGHSEKTKRILDTAEAEEDYDFNVFSKIRKFPITYEDYQFWDKNRKWPEHLNLEPIPQAPSAAKDTPGPRPGGIGDNSGASEEEIQALSLDVLRDQIAALKPQVEKLAKVTSQEDGDAAQGLRTRLTSLASEGEKLRVIQKEPHLQAGRAVDAAWNPLLDDAKALASTLRKAIEEHATAELKRKRAIEEAERQRAIEEARAQQVAREEAARAEAARIEAGKPAPEPVKEAPASKPDPAPLPPAEVAAPPAATVFRGTQGRKTSAKIVIVPTIVDQDAVYEALKKNPEVVALLKMLVERVYRSYGPGMPDMKGVTSVERAAIR